MKKFIPVLIIIAICAAFFYPTLTRGLIPVPTDTLIGLYHPWFDQKAGTNPRGIPFKNFLITDPVRQQIPWRKLVIDELKKGNIPAWNAYNFSGTPLLANIQAGIFYPLNIVFFIFPFYIAWTVLIVFQPILAAVFLYIYLKSKKIDSAVSLFGGIIWAFCGFSVAWLTWGTIVSTALWLPLLLLSIDKLAENGNLFWTTVFVLSSAFAFFAGHAQIALYIFIIAAAYGIKKLNRWVIFAAAAAIAIASIQWIPFIQFLSHSSRLGDINAWTKAGWFLPWQNLIQFVAPDFFGNPATLNYRGIWNYGEFIGYIGIFPLLFACYAVIVRNDRLTRFYALFAGIVFLFLLPTPLAKLPYQFHIPVLYTLQPTRLMVLVDFCLIMLAVLGLDAFIKKPDKKIFLIGGIFMMIILVLYGYAARAHLEVSTRNLILPGVLLVLSIGTLVARKWKQVFVVLVLSITVFDLFRFGWKFTPFTPVSYFFPETNAVSFLQSQKKPFRVVSLDNRIMPPNTGAYYGIESAEGYDPLFDARYEEFVAALNRGEPNISPPFGFNRIITVSGMKSPLLPLLNVKYIMTLEDIRSPDLELSYREGDTRIYWYKKALPRIYPVESVVFAGNKQEAMNLLYAKSFRPQKTAILEEQGSFSSSPLADSDVIKITSYGDSFLQATSALAGDHFVVIGNMFDNGWKITIDGTPAKMYRADYLFMGISVPKGNHIITLRYE